ncbi:uncharacterized protein LOC136039272 [Artemia franciscana]|uniref:uncharacterized protein LOC136039272 n=1 Tax=Artemia franciscana TaxID=6661 RepID=UPI0032DA6821
MSQNHANDVQFQFPNSAQQNKHSDNTNPTVSQQYQGFVESKFQAIDSQNPTGDSTVQGVHQPYPTVGDPVNYMQSSTHVIPYVESNQGQSTAAKFEQASMVSNSKTNQNYEVLQQDSGSQDLKSSHSHAAEQYNPYELSSQSTGTNPSSIHYSLQGQNSAALDSSNGFPTIPESETLSYTNADPSFSASHDSYSSLSEAQPGLSINNINTNVDGLLSSSGYQVPTKTRGSEGFGGHGNTGPEKSPVVYTIVPDEGSGGLFGHSDDLHDNILSAFVHLFLLSSVFLPIGMGIGTAAATASTSLGRKRRNAIGYHTSDILEENYIKQQIRAHQELVAQYVLHTELGSKSNQCLESFACLGASPQKKIVSSSFLSKKAMQLTVSMLIDNKYVPRNLKERLQRAAIYGEENEEFCRIKYSCGQNPHTRSHSTKKKQLRV